MGINGEGIGYDHKKPIFIPQALENELVDAKVVENFGRYGVGELVKVIHPIKERMKPKCNIQHLCGSCPLMIVSYKKQLLYKRLQVVESLYKYAGIKDEDIADIIGSEDIFNYRNQCKMPVRKIRGKLIAGFYQSNSNYFVPCNQCYIHNQEIEDIRGEIMDILTRNHYNEFDANKRKGIRYIVIRSIDHKVQVCIVSGEDKIDINSIEAIKRIKGVESIWQSININKRSHDIFGSKMIALTNQHFIDFKFDHLKLEIGPRSFFQLHSEQAQVLYRYVTSLIPRKVELIVEAYCGIGAISLYLKDKGERLVGIEINPDAIANANRNAKINDVHNIEFICDDASKRVEIIARKKIIDVLVIDPPRTGLDEAIKETLMHAKIKQIIYISCNPATLGKDLDELLELYDYSIIQPIDLFPHTAKVEVIVSLKRRR